MDDPITANIFFFDSFIWVFNNAPSLLFMKCISIGVDDFATQYEVKKPI